MVYKMTVLKSEYISVKKTRKITFDPNVKVTLIPSILDYKKENLDKDIWMSQSEIRKKMNKIFVKISEQQKKIGIETYKEAYKNFIQEEIKNCE